MIQLKNILKTKKTNKSRKLRIYPNKKHEEIIWLGFRFRIRAWNICHNEKLEFDKRKQELSRSTRYNINITPENYYPNYGKAITENKDDLDKLADSKIKNYVVKSDNNAWKKYYDEYLPKNGYDENKPWLGRPSFKSYRKNKKSYTGDKPKITDDKLKLPKLGYIKFRGNLLDNEIANYTISYKNGKYYISIIYKDVEIQTKKYTNKDLGMDWGETTFYTLSSNLDDTDRLNPIINLDLENKINSLQQQLSRKVGSGKGEKKSNGYLRLKNKIDRLKEYRSNCLDEWEHQISYKLVTEYDNIFTEDLNHKAIHQQKKRGVSKLKKLYYRAGMFLGKISYKLSWYKDTEIIEVNKDGTSKTCSTCGHYNHELKQGEKSWICPNCGIINRDKNAAINILNKGLVKIGKELGTNFYKWSDLDV